MHLQEETALLSLSDLCLLVFSLFGVVFFACLNGCCFCGYASLSLSALAVACCVAIFSQRAGQQEKRE